MNSVEIALRKDYTEANASISFYITEMSLIGKQIFNTSRSAVQLTRHLFRGQVHTILHARKTYSSDVL